MARVCFNPANDAYLAVAGFAEARVFVLNEDGEVVDRLRVGPETWPLDGARGAILDVKWATCEPACVAIVVETHVAVFDLSVSAAAPAGVARLASGDGVVAAAFAARKGASALLLLADTGDVYAHALEGGADAFRRESDIVVSSASRLALPEECRGRAVAAICAPLARRRRVRRLRRRRLVGGVQARLQLRLGEELGEPTCACVRAGRCAPGRILGGSGVRILRARVGVLTLEPAESPRPRLSGGRARGPDDASSSPIRRGLRARGAPPFLVSLAEDAAAAQPRAGEPRRRFPPPEVPLSVV